MCQTNPFDGFDISRPGPLKLRMHPGILPFYSLYLSKVLKVQRFLFKGELMILNGKINVS